MSCWSTVLWVFLNHSKNSTINHLTGLGGPRDGIGSSPCYWLQLSCISKCLQWCEALVQNERKGQHFMCRKCFIAPLLYLQTFDVAGLDFLNSQFCEHLTSLFLCHQVLRPTWKMLSPGMTSCHALVICVPVRRVAAVLTSRHRRGQGTSPPWYLGPVNGKAKPSD
jgi:hypothetical protein